MATGPEAAGIAPCLTFQAAITERGRENAKIVERRIFTRYIKSTTNPQWPIRYAIDVMNTE